jgi:gamma-glutamyltranspeptidase / glutathione hydrolase / leukotriene-C4 hydrolase
LNIDWGQDVSEAIEYGRLHDQLYPLQVDVEDIISSDIIDFLKEQGHNVTGSPSNTACFSIANEYRQVLDINRGAAVVQAVARKEGKIYGELQELVQLHLFVDAHRLRAYSCE